MSESKRKRAGHDPDDAMAEQMNAGIDATLAAAVESAPAALASPAPARPGMLLVAAPQGLVCPAELSRKRITDKPQWVRNTTYYRRRIAEGSLFLKEKG